MVFLSMKIILLVLLTGITSNHSQEIQLCFTPDNIFGNCQNIRSCNAMVQFLLAKGNFTLPERKFLNKYQCNKDKDSLNICCPNNGNIVSSLDSSPKIETPSTAKVKDHRNLRLLPAECGPSDVGFRITHGNKTGLFEFPWMTLLSYQTRNSRPSFRCGGTIISNRYILTAAHCIQDITLFKVRVGEHSIEVSHECEIDDDGQNFCADAVQDLFIEEVIIHSGYNTPQRANDIGLVRLNTSISTSKSVQPICLPIEDGIAAKISEQTQFTVTGWGATDMSESSDELLQTKVAAVPIEECQERYKALFHTISESQICARSINGSDSCNGDSGGPIQTILSVNDELRYVQSGIVSAGPKPCAIEGIPGVYTRVDKYVNWILDNMRD